MFDELGDDHRSWLLVAAHNYLGQRQADRAITLLRLLELLVPHDPQCRKLLAYAYWIKQDRARCAAAVEKVLEQALEESERAAMEMMGRRLGRPGSVAAAAVQA